MNGQRLRPLSVGDIFDEGFDLYKRNFVFLLLAAAAVVVPLDILLAFLTPILMPSVFDLFGVTINQADAFWVWTVTSLVKTIFFLPLYLVTISPVVSAASARYLEQETTLGTMFRLSLRRLPALLTAAVLTGFLLTVGLALCGVLWLVVATQLLFVLEALLVEGQGPIGAMRRSGALVGGYGFRVFGCLLLLGMVLFIVSLGIRLPLAYLVDGVLNVAPGAAALYSGGANGVGTSQQQVVSLISSGLAHMLLIPFIVCVITVLYYDLRIRKEGVDIEMLALELNYPPLSALGPYLPPVPTFSPIVRPGKPHK
ncbi:MAG: hypothetical protein ACRYFS_02110 [Janthinobacterium lividum]